jgi:acylglycerol lipase
MSEVEMRTTRDGVEQLVRSWPTSEPPWARMLIVHGIAEHSGRYEAVGAGFAKRGIECSSFDLRGHGKTAGRRGYVESFDRFLDDVEDHLARHRESGLPVVLLGHSLGGLIAAAYAASDRPPPDRLVLSAPALDATVPGWQRIAAPILAKRLPTLAIPNPIDVSMLSRDPEVGRAYLDDPLNYRKTTAKLGNEIFGAMERTKRALTRIAVRTLVIHGGEDRLVPTAFSEAIGTLPDATRKVYPGLRHECFNEPEGPEVVAFIERWLRDELGTRAA